jgi:Trk K+ transport system NAD-binding subunit
LGKTIAKDHKVVQGDAMNLETLTNAIQGQEIVYINLAGDLEKMALNIVSAMKTVGAKRVIAISSIGIYSQPLRLFWCRTESSQIL